MGIFLSYFLPLIVAICALIPPIQFYLLPPPYEYWPMFIAIVGFLGVRILFIRTNIFIKATALLTYLICFFSAAPYMSFNQYASIVACCYLYIALTRMTTWKPMFATMKTLLVFNSILLTMQFMGTDRLYNFGLDRIAVYGVVGQHMWMGSFSVILGACLSIINPAFFLFPVIVGIITKSTWTLVCAGIGLWMRAKSKKVKTVAVVILIGATIMCVKTHKIQAALDKNAGRLIVWKYSIELLNRRPLEGWGPGSFKYIFPALSDMTSIPWKTAHNDWIQFDFELGYILGGLIKLGWLWVLARAIKLKMQVFLAGFVVISFDMLVHFPTRLIHCVPLIICFLAYHNEKFCKKKREEATLPSSDKFIINKLL